MQQGAQAPHQPDAVAPAPIDQAVLDVTGTIQETPLDLEGITLTSALPEPDEASPPPATDIDAGVAEPDEGAEPREMAALPDIAGLQESDKLPALVADDVVPAVMESDIELALPDPGDLAVLPDIAGLLESDEMPMLVANNVAAAVPETDGDVTLPGPGDVPALPDTVEMQDNADTEAPKEAEFVVLAAYQDLSLPPAPSDPATPLRLGCDVNATATPTAMAMVALEVIAPCLRNQRLTVHHNGMMFTEATNDFGRLSATVPALAKNAVFVIDFGHGKGTVAMARVPELEDFDRVVLQWAGRGGFEVHAREFGAAYGETGHVWRGVDPEATRIHQGNSGFVTRLGAADTLMPQLAEVYSFPTGTSDQNGIIALTVETEVTRDNCGRDIAAQSLELRGEAHLRTRDLVISMPECAAVGDFLVLNKIVDDLKIASR